MAVRILMAPDPAGNPVPVVAAADDDDAILHAMKAWTETALQDPLWRHLHERLRDPEGCHHNHQDEAAGPQRFSSCVFGQFPSIGVYYTTVPMDGEGCGTDGDGHG